MSTGALLRRQRDRPAAAHERPAAAHERRAAIRAVTLLLAAAASALLLTHPPAARQNERSRPGGPAGAPRATALPPALSALEHRTAEGFLAGYLSYVYGRAPASWVRDATVGLARSLQAQPVRVPPGLRLLEPRVLRLAAVPAPAGLLGVTAVISDEPTVEYRLALLITPAYGGLRVSAVESR